MARLWRIEWAKAGTHFQKYIRERNILGFFETWLTPPVQDCAGTLVFFSTLCSDRTKESRKSKSNTQLYCTEPNGFKLILALH